ncbi:MAG: hypothetical protein IPI08_16510 [Betaproteobacteria bacterium]|nr:hypothetical protein [Betaproteobacteria bacterium]
MSHRADRRCGPLRQADPASPGHQGTGLKSARLPAVCNCQAWRPARCSVARISALAAPAWARTRRNSTRCSLALPSMARRTAFGAPSTAPVRSSVQSTCRSGGAAPAAAPGSGEGRPWTRAETGPVSVIGAARLSSRCGVTAASRVSSVSSAPCHSALPLQRPAPRAASASSTSKRVTCSRSGCSSEPRACSARLRTGSRPSFQRPGRALRSSTVARKGSLRAVLTRSALPLRRVRGACADSAARSSAVVCRLSPASGQACSNCSLARRSSAGASCGPRGTPRSVASSSISAALPLARSTAAQAGASPPSAGATVPSSASGSGAWLPMRALALKRTPCQSAPARATRCSAPGRASNTSSCSARWRNGASSSTISSSTCAAATATCTGPAMLAGTVMVPSPGGPVTTVTRRTANRAMSTPSQARGWGRQCQTRPSARRSSSVSEASPSAQPTCRRSACQWSPSRAPRKPLTCTAGRLSSSQRLPAS